MTKITVYVPTLNSQKTIKKCLLSILNQSIKPNNIIIVDGNSTDKTKEIFDQIKNKTKIPMSFIVQKKKGLANARNIAITHTNSDFIVSFDSDVVADKNWIKESLIHLDDKKIIGVGGKLIEKHKNNVFDNWRSIHMKQNFGSKQVLNPKFLIGANTIFRTNILKKIMYNENYVSNYEDVDISKRILDSGYNLFYEPKAKCYHLRRDNLKSILDTYYNWTFYGYPIPNSLIKLTAKLTVFNMSKSIKLLLKDINQTRYNFILIDILIYFHNSFKDILFYYKNNLHINIKTKRT